MGQKSADDSVNRKRWPLSRLEDTAWAEPRPGLGSTSGAQRSDQRGVAARLRCGFRIWFRCPGKEDTTNQRRDRLLSEDSCWLLFEELIGSGRLGIWGSRRRRAWTPQAACGVEGLSSHVLPGEGSQTAPLSRRACSTIGILFSGERPDPDPDPGLFRTLSCFWLLPGSFIIHSPLLSSPRLSDLMHIVVCLAKTSSRLRW